LVSSSNFGFSLEEARELLPTTYIGTGMDADELLAGNIPAGMTADTIRPSLMRLFRDRAHFEEFEAEMKAVPDTDDGTLLAQTRIGKLAAALGLRPTTMDNKWTAQILMQHQAQLLED
jgi:hypothetical protein